MTRRLPDWRPRLEAEVQRKALHAFAWGRNDCCLFAGDLVRAMTGLDFGARYRGRYATPIGAARVLRRLEGVKTLGELCDVLAARDQWVEIEPRDARSGDPCLVRGTFGETLGIRFGGFVAVPAERGVELMPAATTLRAWAL